VVGDQATRRSAYAPERLARPRSGRSFGGNIVSGFVSPAWMPSSLREAARAGDATPGELESGAAWAHLLAKLQSASATVLSDSVPRNPVDMAAGFRHLLVLLWIGIDDALRRESSPVLAVRPSNT